MTWTPEEQKLIDDANAYHEGKSGHSRLWGWFGLSRASFLVLPRVLMHEMPDDWQKKMAVLLEEYEQTWDDGLPGGITVSYKVKNRFVSFPEWVCNYRRPWSEFIDTLRRKS